MYRNDSRSDRSILVVAFGRQILGLDPGTGAVRWEYPMKSLLEIELIERDGRLYCANAMRLVCLGYPGGEPIFDVEIPGEFNNRPSLVLEEGRLFLASGGEVTAFDLDGNVLWHNRLEGRGVGRVALGFPGNFRQADGRE